LPSTGVVHVRMHIDEFPWGTFSGPLSGAGMFVTVLTGNQGPDNTLPKDALQLNVGLLNSNYTANRTSMLIVGQSIRGSYVGSVNRLDPVSLPLPGDVVGFWINVDTREIGLSFRITAVDPNLPPPGDYDLEPLKDSQGNAFLLPQGVTSVAIGLGALVNQVPVTDPLQGARFGATLLTDACGSSEPPPQTLPNGNPFMGKAAPKKFQGLPFPFVGQPPFAGTGNGNK
ncbi:MAG: hypothetical protein K0S16_1003, partial [Moraxellaceae bacterium]|nr:hypothetical protein [Moraxellaceae bacterium]